MKKIPYILFLVAILISMAIAFGDSTAPANGTSITGPTVTGTNTIGFAGWRANQSTDTITAVTWGGASMTKITSVTFDGGTRWASLWYIVNPSSAATITQTGGATTAACAWYYTGASQTGQPDASGSHAATTSATNAISATVVAANCWLTSFNCDNAGNITFTLSIGTARQTNSGTGLSVGDSNATISTGSNTEIWTAGSGTPSQGGILASFKPAVASPVNSGFFFALAR